MTQNNLIITCMRNEGPFILEWLAYHRSIGFNQFLVFTNDCDDGTDTLLDALQDAGYVQHLENPWRTMKQDLNPQKGALRFAEDLPISQQADWILVSDVDEFLNIHVGDGTLPALLSSIDPNTDAIAVQWRLFGNADITQFADTWVTEQFENCAPEYCPSPIQAWAFKTLFRAKGPHKAGKYTRFGVHRPLNPGPGLDDDITFLTGSGTPASAKYIKNGWRFGTECYGYGAATLNHYSVRSAESFLVKRARGRVNHTERDQGLAYWLRMNFNMERDVSIKPHLARAKAELARMVHKHPKLASLHEAAVAAHRAKVAALLQEPSVKEFFDRITAPDLRKLSRHINQLSRQHLTKGPDAVPKAIHNRIAAVIDL